MDLACGGGARIVYCKPEMNACPNCSEPVRGVGDIGDVFSGIGDWFSSGIGAELLKTGLSFGVGYGLQQITGGGSGSQQRQTGNLTGGVTVNPAGSGIVPQAGTQPIVIQQAAATPMPTWVLPAAVFGGMAVLLLALKR